MKRFFLLRFIFLCLIANSLYAATWEDFKANAKDAKFVYQHFIWDGGSIAYEFEYMLDGNPQSVFITDRKSKFIKPALCNLYIDIGTQGKRDKYKGFELKDEADKAFVLDFLFAFADYKEIYDTLKFFGKEASTPPTKDHPKNMQERSNKYVKEMVKKNKEKRLEKVAKLEETMQPYILSSDDKEPKLEKFIEENPKIASYLDITTPNIDYENIDTFFDIKDKDEEVFVMLSALEKLIDNPMPLSSQYALKCWGMYRYVLAQKDGVIPFSYAKLFFKILKNNVTQLEYTDKMAIACLEKILLNDNPSGFTKEFISENKNNPDFKNQRAKLIKDWEDFYIKNYQ